jgi:DNA-binding CsgD family transcriptional regulator
VLTKPAVVGRRAELELLEELVARLPERPHSVVLAGAAGIGKTTLWLHAVAQARVAGYAVLETRASGAEAQLSFAGLADLLEGVDLDVLPPLPRVQRRALDGVLLRRDVDERVVPPRAVATAFRSVLRALAADRPVLVAVDDAQWLDRPSADAIAYTVRRLALDRVGVLASVRRSAAEPTVTFADGIPAERRSEVALGPLSLAALHEILVHELGRALPRPTLVKVTAASGGNPFYALEIARELIRLELTAPLDRLPVPAEPSALLTARVARLPRETREALLLASCLQAPTTEVVPDSALAPAEEAQVVRIERDRIEFTHPLLAAAVYRSASTSRRRAAHRALAEVVRSREERVRHLALAGSGPDEALAAELEAVAQLAAARGATAGAAELAALAVERTPPDDRVAAARRRASLGNYLYVAGDVQASATSLEEALVDAPPVERARALLDLGAVYSAMGDARGIPLLERGLREVDDPRVAAEAHARLAWLSAVDAPRMIAHAGAALDLLAGRDAPAVESFALQHLALGRLLAGEAADHDLIERSLDGQRHAEGWLLSSVGALWPSLFDDFELARQRTIELLAVAEEQGNEPERQSDLIALALIELWTGAPVEAEALAREALALAEQIEQPPMACVARYALGLVCAQSGDVDEARRLGAESLAWLGAPSAPAAILFTQTHAMLGFAALTAGELEEADRQSTLADEASARWAEPAPFRFHADQVEAALGMGDLDRAAALVERLERRAAAIPRPWLCVVAARSRALVDAGAGDLDGALRAAEQATSLQARLEMPFERARTLLVLGELQRRRRGKRQAREALGEALAIFGSLGAEPWADRARAELARVRTRRASDTLTPTEERIALLAAEGLSNRVIAERVFVSVGTVEANLSRAYRKLGISSRAQLARALDRR